MKIYVTHRGLTDGILIFEEAHAVPGHSDVCAVRLSGHEFELFYQPHWHRTLKKALQRVEEMRQAAIKTGTKELANVEKHLTRLKDYKPKLVDKREKPDTQND